MVEAQQFLSALFAGAPNQAAIQLWNKDTKKNHYYAVGNLDHAVSHIKHHPDTDVYMAAGLGSKTHRPNKVRIPASNIAAIPGFWADIDINGGPESKSGAAPDIDEALALAHKLLEPTVIVNSGYGIQAWWLLEDGPWIFGSDATAVTDREHAARLSVGFQSALRAQAKQMGWTIDSTHDLARLMRVPGTFNHKGAEPAPVTLLHIGEERYSLDDIGMVAQHHISAASDAVKRITGEGLDVQLNGSASVPSWRVGQLLAVDVDFKNVWDRRKGGRTAQWSDSEFDLSIATRLADAGCSDQEIADALVHNRLQHGDPKDKSQRVDYIRGTIGKAKLRADLEEQNRETERIRSDAEDQLEAIAGEGATAEPSRTVSLFTQLLAGPEVKELVQDSRDPDQARFRIILADGREVPIGSGTDLLDPNKFRAAFAVVTGHVIHIVKRDKWHKIVQALLHAAVINEDAEDSRAARGASFVRDFVDRGLSTDRDAACQVHEPFTHDGEVFVPLAPLAHFLRRMRGERMVDADIKQLLIAAGFERKTVNYIKDSGRKSSRSYWVGTTDMVDLVEETPHED